jgi:hypothetical protein
VARTLAAPAPVTLTLSDITPTNTAAPTPSISLSFIGADAQATTYLEVEEVAGINVISTDGVQSTSTLPTATLIGTVVMGKDFVSYTRAPSSDAPYAINEYCTFDGNGNEICSDVLVPSGTAFAGGSPTTVVTTGVATAVMTLVVDVPDKASGGAGKGARLNAVLTSMACAVVGVLLVGV